MILSKSATISEIDSYLESELGISTVTLMGRAGEAVANAVISTVPKGSSVLILVGKGNNGGDGYAAATLLADEYSVSVIDVFSLGQRSDAGKHYLALARERVSILPLDFSEPIIKAISDSDCIIDAIFGTGLSGEYPSEVKRLSSYVRSSSAYKISIDVPLGISADLGTVCTDVVYEQNLTVALSFIKPGLTSYPAKKYVGKLIFDNLNLPFDKILSEFIFSDYLIDYDLARLLMPKRDDNSNKGSFGKLLMCCGSPEYLGAPRLALETALRSGVGLVGFVGERAVVDSLLPCLPEAIYNTADDSSLAECILKLAPLHTAILIGSGSGRRECILETVRALFSTHGSPVILDADALNLISESGETVNFLASSNRPLVLTPHPLEMARLIGCDVAHVQSNRISVAKDLAKAAHATVVLKGAATIVTDGKEVYINSSGSSALAKAGSGDVLAALIAALIASGVAPVRASALAVWLHGAAADSLALELSQLGVTPSDLPREIARQIRKLEK